MMLVNELSYQYGLLNEADLAELNLLCSELLSSHILAVLTKIDIKKLIDLLKKDKKTIGSVTSFVFLKSPGDIRFIQHELTDRLVTEISQALKKIMGLHSRQSQ